MFKPNPAITNPILIDNKEERKREETRLHKKPRYRGGFPKEIKMGEVLMPPYYKKAEDSALDPHQSGMVEENINKQLASSSTQTIRQQGDSSTLGLRRSELVEERVGKQPMNFRQTRIEDPRILDPHHGLIGDRSLSDLNALLMESTNQD